MNVRLIFFCWNIILAAPCSLLAGAPIKSIDQAGNVTYSDKPVADAATHSEVLIDPAPSQDVVDAARQRANKVMEQAEQAQKVRDAEPEERKEAATGNTEITEPVEEPKTRRYYPVYQPPPRPLPPVVKPPHKDPVPPAYHPYPPVNQPSPKSDSR